MFSLKMNDSMLLQSFLMDPNPVNVFCAFSLLFAHTNPSAVASTDPLTVSLSPVFIHICRWSKGKLLAYLTAGVLSAFV